jgi:hypothetical protein
MGGGRGWVVVCGVGEERSEEKVEKEYITKNVLTNYFNCIIIFIE